MQKTIVGARVVVDETSIMKTETQFDGDVTVKLTLDGNKVIAVEVTGSKGHRAWAVALLSCFRIKWLRLSLPTLML